MKQLNVIQIIDSTNVGGAEMMAVNIANMLAENGVASFLCVTRKEGPLHENICEDVDYIFLDRKKRLDLKAIRRLCKFVRKHEIDIIHAHSSSIFLAIIIKLLVRKIRVIWHDHYGMDLEHRKSFFLKLCSLRMSSIVAVSAELQDWSNSKLYCKRVEYLPNFAVFTNREKLTQLKGELKKRILHIGGLRPQKDHLNLLKSFLEVRKAHPDWTLHLIGKDYEDHYSQQIHQFITDKELKDSVYFYGVQKDMEHIISQASFGVISSKSEGLPVSLLEYGLGAIPVVATDVGQCLDVIQTRELVVPPNDYIALSKAMLNLIDDQLFLKNEGEKLHFSINKRFSKKEFVKKIMASYSI